VSSTASRIPAAATMVGCGHSTCSPGQHSRVGSRFDAYSASLTSAGNLLASFALERCSRTAKFFGGREDVISRTPAQSEDSRGIGFVGSALRRVRFRMLGQHFQQVRKLFGCGGPRGPKATGRTRCRRLPEDHRRKWTVHRRRIRAHSAGRLRRRRIRRFGHRHRVPSEGHADRRRSMEFRTEHHCGLGK
jgi:hypothetical protein